MIWIVANSREEEIEQIFSAGEACSRKVCSAEGHLVKRCVTG